MMHSFLSSFNSFTQYKHPIDMLFLWASVEVITSRTMRHLGICPMFKAPWCSQDHIRKWGWSLGGKVSQCTVENGWKSVKWVSKPKCSVHDKLVLLAMWGMRRNFTGTCTNPTHKDQQTWKLHTQFWCLWTTMVLTAVLMWHFKSHSVYFHFLSKTIYYIFKCGLCA